MNPQTVLQLRHLRRLRHRLIANPARKGYPPVDAGGLVIVCLACEMDIDGYSDPAEAGYLAGIHNDLHHGSRPEAFVVPHTTWADERADERADESPDLPGALR